MKSFFKKAKGVFVIGFCFLIVSDNAQINLVPNPSFELLDSCVSGTSTFITVLTTWDTLKAGGGGGLVFNACYNYTTESSVPKNLNSAGGCIGFGSYQVAHSGKGYAYLLYFKKNTPAVSWRHYTQAPLTTTLTAGKSYCVTYYASLSNRENMAVDELSAYFDNGTIQSIAPQKEAIATPQIKSSTGVFYMNTLNWMKVQGTFTANGTESYITLGNFRTPATTNYTLFCLTYGVAGYYVDDVSVIETDLPAYAGPDKYILNGDSTFIGRPPEIGLECTWYNGTVTVGTGGGLWVKPNTITTYIVQQNICGLIKSDTVTVTVGYIGINELGINSSEFIILPNPNNGLIQIEILNKEFLLENTEIKIYDVAGQLVFTDKFTGLKKELELNLENGLYFIELINKETNQRTVKKVVIQE